MNKKGFASIYALSILQLVLVFSLLLISYAGSMSIAKKEDSLHQAQLFAIYRVKKRLSMISPEENVDDEIETNDEAKLEGEMIEIPQENTASFPIEQERLFYQGHRISIHYEASNAYVEIEQLHMQLQCDFEKQIILELVYL